MKNVKILGIGVATMDIYLDRGRMYPGGNEYNVAANAQFLGATAGFLGVFANDKAGEILEETLVNRGVDVSMCHHEEGSSGYSLVRLKPDGDRIFLDWNKQGVTDLHPIQFLPDEMEYVKKFDVVCVGRCADVPLFKIMYLHSQKVKVCYDYHAVYSDRTIRKLSPYVEYAFFSCSHLTTEEIKQTLKLACDCGTKIAIGTRGADPILAYDGNIFYEQECQKVTATDALGAGDSFIAGVLCYYLHEKNHGNTQEEAIKTALIHASKHSAHIVQIEGSIGVGYDVDPNNLEDIINMD